MTWYYEWYVIWVNTQNVYWLKPMGCLCSGDAVLHNVASIYNIRVFIQGCDLGCDTVILAVIFKYAFY